MQQASAKTRQAFCPERFSIVRNWPDRRRQYQEEGIDEDVEEKGREVVARIVVAPEADLERGECTRVDEENGVANHHDCIKRPLITTPTNGRRNAVWG